MRVCVKSRKSVCGCVKYIMFDTVYMNVEENEVMALMCMCINDFSTKVCEFVCVKSKN